MKKILIHIDSEKDVDVVCDCTDMHTVEDAKECLDYHYDGCLDEEMIAEIATSLIEEGEYADGDELTFKIIDLSDVEHPLSK